MKYIGQFTIILAITFIAEILAFLIPLKIPAGIYGLLIMLLALFLKIVKVSHIKESVAFLLEIMPIVFIPASAAIILAGDKLMKNLFPFIFITIVSTIVVLVCSGLSTQIFYNKKLRKEKFRLHEKEIK